LDTSCAIGASNGKHYPLRGLDIWYLTEKRMVAMAAIGCTEALYTAIG